MLGLGIAALCFIFNVLVWGCSQEESLAIALNFMIVWHIIAGGLRLLLYICLLLIGLKAALTHSEKEKRNTAVALILVTPFATILSMIPSILFIYATVSASFNLVDGTSMIYPASIYLIGILYQIFCVASAKKTNDT